MIQRNRNERVFIGPDIVVTVCQITGASGSDSAKVKLGITAPPNVRIDREEIAVKRKADGRHDAEKTTIYWHDRETARTWPEGSCVLVKTRSNDVLAENHFRPLGAEKEPDGWQYALVREGE